MTSTQDKPTQAQTSPLNVKEQLEATASRFWTSVTNNKGNDGVMDGGIKVPGVAVGLFTKSSFSDDDEMQKRTSCNQPNGLQIMLSTMFASCTTGGQNLDSDSNDGSEDAPSLLKHSNRSRTVATSALTPSSSRGETSAPRPVTPSPLHQQKPASAVKAAIQESSKALFKNNHEIAQEAIHRLRQQHQLDQSEKLVMSSLHESEVAVDAERCSLLSARSSMFSNNPSTLSMGPSTLSNNRTLSTFLDAAEANQQSLAQSKKSSLQKLISNRANKKNAKVPAAAAMKPATHKHQEHSFFPASKPKDSSGKTRKEKRVREKLKRNKGVPKEVTPTSPVRMLRSRNNQRQKQLLNSTASSGDNLFNDDFNVQCEANENRDVDDSWDIENDGISDISQSTVDRMVLAISQHLRVFPEEAETLNRIHSDVTDPAPKQGAHSSNSDQLFPMMGGDVAGFKRIVTPPRGIRQATKGMSPSNLNRTFGSMGTKSFFTKTTHSTQTNDFANAWKIDEQKFWETEVAKESPQQLRDAKSPSKMMIKKQHTKRCESSTITTATTPTTLLTSPHSPPSFFINRKQLEESQEITFTDHDKLMDNLLHQNELETAEI